MLGIIPLLTASLAWSGAVADAVHASWELRSNRLATEAPTIPDWAYDHAEEGKVAAGLSVEEHQPVAKAWGVAIFDLPIEAVWMAVNDEEAFPTVSKVTVSQVIEGDRRRTGRLVFGYMPISVPFVKDRWWMVSVRHNGEMYAASGGVLWEKAWTDATDRSRLDGKSVATYADAGQSLGFSHGSWLLHRLDDDRTLAEYFVWTDIGGSLPSGPISRFAKGAVRHQVVAIRCLAEQRQGDSRDAWLRPDQQPL
ncbi:MAG: hypothetical protein JRI25_12575 [Deltaproteobacteria bacterium]|nr:hypothetical protein [Deltaproteobacteria bacterium]MBW2255416.1 hypothetical protein [Deltaproteobacteria bacterium]